MPVLERRSRNEELERLIGLFLRAETDIINEIGRLRSLGLADYHAVAALERVQNILQKLTSDCFEYAPKMIEKQFYARLPQARRMGGMTQQANEKAYAGAAALTGEQHAAAGRLVMNLMGEINEASETVMQTLESALIGRTKNDVFRKTGLEQTAFMEAEGRGPYKALPGFIEQLRREGVRAFTDRAGRSWSLHTYGSMVLRTTSRQAEVLAVLTADPEHDLYQISSHNTTCKICAPLEGRVYSRSGRDPDFPPLTLAFGKVDPVGPEGLSNTWLNIHPNCLHSIHPWTPEGRTQEEIQKIKDFSSPKKNPLTRDPRTQRQIDAYRSKERERQRWLASYRQWEKYRLTLGDGVPKSYQTFEKHKRAGDEKYRLWQKEYRFTTTKERFDSLIGVKASTGIEVTGVSRHVIDRAITRHFSAEGAIDALQNPVKVGRIKTDEKGVSQTFTGKKAAITINPETGNIITGWSKKK